MTVLDRREAEMKHLVGELPVAVEVFQSRVPAHGYPAVRPAVTETHSIGNAPKLGNSDAHAGVCDWEPPEISGHGFRGSRYPIQPRRPAKLKLIGADRDIQCRSPDVDALRSAGAIKHRIQ